MTKVTREDVFKRVKDLVTSRLSLREDFSEKAHFINDLGADSLDIVELVMAIEEEFKCEIDDAEAEKMRTVGDVVDYIWEKVSKEDS